MNLLALASAVLALLMYIPLCYQIWTGKTTQNLATFILWGLLDAIAAGSTILERGNFLLPLFYTLGATSVIICLIRARAVKWTWLETLISVLVVICIIVWKTVGNEMTIIVSTLAMAIASVPQLVDAWKNPHNNPVLVYVGFMTANALGTDRKSVV